MDEIKTICLDIKKEPVIDLNDHLDEGWKVCDGRFGTVDLSGRFIITSSNIVVYAQKV